MTAEEQYRPPGTLKVGMVMLVFGFLFSGISFFDPHWRYDINSGEDTGLWGTCRDMSIDITELDVMSYRCIWFHEDNMAWERWIPGWHKTAQALFALGFVSVFAVLLIASVHLCCCCRDSLSVVKIVGAILILAALMMFGSLGLFGGFSWKEYNTSVNSGLSKFNWGFYTGIGGGGLCFLAGIVYLIETCRYRSHEGYTRGDAVV